MRTCRRWRQVLCRFITTMGLLFSTDGARALDKCGFDNCRNQFQANELGMRLETLSQMQRLRLTVPRWMISALEPTSKDLNVGFNLQELLESGISEPSKQIKQRLFEVHGSLISSSFALGSYIGEELFRSVAVSEGRGEFAGVKSPTLLIADWSVTAMRMNVAVTQMAVGVAEVPVKVSDIKNLQTEVCALKNRLDIEWQRPGFDCEELLARLKAVVNEAALLEASKNASRSDRNPVDLKLNVVLGARNLVFTADGRAIDGIDIWDYQDKRPVTKSDVSVGKTAMAVRLGRDDDMAVLAAFRYVGETICARYMYLPLRNGDNIIIQQVPAGDDIEAFAIFYGDNMGVAAVRHSDFDFLWDPSTTLNRAKWHLSPPIPPLGVRDGRCS